MPTEEKFSYIPSRLKNASQNGHVAGAVDIYDDTFGKTQAAINSDLEAPAQGIKDRVAQLEQEVSFDGTIQVENVPTGVVSPSAKVPTATAVRGAIDAKVGYAECGTDSNTQRKDVIVPGFVLTNGGHIKIKMTKVNTANNAQLNISPTSTVVSANTKTLLYNGEAVSASNTWEEGEVISVYYDGTNYQASNSQGGGGKAEKIKYDNSQSGLASTDVQGALDELGQRTVVIDSDNIINDYSDSLGCMGTSGNNVIWVSNNSNRKHRAIPVSGEQFVKITAGANSATIAFATSAYITPTSSSHGHTISSLCANTGLYNVDANNTSVFQIPVDCAYILINITSNGSTYYTPNSLYLGNNVNSIVKDNKNVIDEEVIGRLPISLNMKRYIATNKAIGATVSTIPLFNNTTQSYAYAIIPCSSGDKFVISGTGGNTPRLWCFVNSHYDVISVADSGAVLANAKLTAPSNSSYLIVNVDTRQAYNIAKLCDTDNSRVDRINENVEVMSEQSGMYNQYNYNVVVGSYNGDTGILGATSDYNRISTAKIACTGINSIKTNCKMNNYTASITVLFYDSSDNYLDKIVSKYNGNEYTEVAVPADAAYFAMNLTSIGEDVSYVKIYLQKTNGYIESIESIESQMSCIGTVEVADVDICLSDFKTNSNSDDDAIKDMLDYGNMFVKKTYHIDIPVTISKVIYLQSNTTMLVEEDIKQADGMFECVFRGGNVVLDDNDFAYLPDNIQQIENVRIIGVGNNRLIEGPDVNYVINHPTYGNQAAVGDYYGIRTHQIDLTMCSNFEIANLSFTKTRGWCLNFDFCDHGKIHDLHISSNVKNGDGVDIRTGCHDIEIYNVNGDTSDDLLAINGSTTRTATGSTSSLPYLYGSEASGKMRPYFLDRRRFDIHDINAHDCQYQRVVANVGCVMIVVAQKGTRVYNINLDNLTEISTLAGKINIFLGSFRDSNNTYTDGDVHNVRINRAHSTTSNACITANKVCRNVWVNKCVADNNVLGEIIDHNTNGFTFTNSVGNVVEYPGYSNLDG